MANTRIIADLRRHRGDSSFVIEMVRRFASVYGAMTVDWVVRPDQANLLPPEHVIGQADSLDTSWSPGHENDISKAARVHELTPAYRVRGHLLADTDPLQYTQRKHPDLDINQHGLTLWDLEREFATGGFGGKPLMKLREILGVLRDSYCRTVGVEYMHMQNPDERSWLQARVERPHGRSDHDEQVQILSRLNVAEAFEMFLQTKYVGQRRFSLEGAESLIPLLDAVLTEAAVQHLDEAYLGMAHRGRLNAGQ